MRLLTILILLSLSTQADAQLFRRRTASVQSYGHWSYPGDIASHLQSTHGQSVSGLSREQMLNLHDALHEGRNMAPITRPTTANIFRLNGMSSQKASDINTRPVTAEYATQYKLRVEVKPEPIKKKEFWW